jgi:hypothetical protein
MLHRQMNMYQRVSAQSEAALFPVTALASTMTAGRDSSWRSALLESFDAIHLSEMGHVALFRRTDTKYLLSEVQAFRALARLTDHYRILEIDGRRLHRYRTLYFDTQNLALYRQHHNGWRNRYKVRERAYADSDLAFLEIKHKINTNTTIKSRIRTQELRSQIARDAEPFLRTHYPYQVEELEARLFNSFQRITLVSTHSVERLTVDVGLRFLWNGVRASLAGIAIAEVKQDGFSMDSEFIRQMRASGVRATSFSKYCIGVSMLYPEVKHNRFKPQIRQIAKLSYEGRTACQTYSFH